MEPDKELFSRAIIAHKSGDLDTAVNLYQNLLDSSPTNVEALDLLGVLFAQQGKYRLAYEQFAAALVIEPENPQLLNHVAQVYERLEHEQEALQNYKKALTLKPDYVEAALNLGQLWQTLGENQHAVQCYTSAVEQSPDEWILQHRLALCLLDDKKLDEAKGHWECVTRCQPAHLPSYFFLGTIAYEQNCLMDAVKYFDQALQIEPSHLETLSNLGAVYLKLGEIVKAKQCFEQALENEPSHLFARTNLAAVLLNEGEIELATQHYEKLLQHIPQDFTAHYNLGTIYMQQQNWDSAQGHLFTAVKIDPDSFAAMSNLAHVLLKKHEREAAIQCYRAALKIEPKNESVQYILHALTGEDSPKMAPQKYVEELFDNYAHYFDGELLEKLQYKVPQLLFTAMQPYLEGKSALKIIDLGCGTGLCGESFRDYANELIGIDLSKKMLILAEEKNVYTELKHADLVAGLESMHQVDLVLAADVLVYVGDLTYVLTAIEQALQPGGYFAFSIEELSVDASYQLQPTGRFAHSETYVLQQATEVGFNMIKSNAVTLRLQGDMEVKGRIIILQK